MENVFHCQDCRRQRVTLSSFIWSCGMILPYKYSRVKHKAHKGSFMLYNICQLNCDFPTEILPEVNFRSCGFFVWGTTARSPTCPSTCWPGRSQWRGAGLMGPRWRPLQREPQQPGWWCHGTAGWTGTGSWYVMLPPCRSLCWSGRKRRQPRDLTGMVICVTFSHNPT